MARVGSCSGAGPLKVPRPAPSQCLRSLFAVPVTHTKTDLRQMRPKKSSILAFDKSGLIGLRCKTGLFCPDPQCIEDIRHKIRLNWPVFFRASGESTNHWTESIECQIVANLDSFFSVTLLKHFCQSVSFYYWKTT
jgi:hypothetical protein